MFSHIYNIASLATCPALEMFDRAVEARQNKLLHEDSDSPKIAIGEDRVSNAVNQGSRWVEMSLSRDENNVVSMLRSLSSTNRF